MAVARFGQDDEDGRQRLKTGTGFAYAKLSEILPQLALLASSG
ncbi:MAG: hypothetical protein WCA22_20340 [Candidatus Binatus sp.]